MRAVATVDAWMMCQQLVAVVGLKASRTVASSLLQAYP